MAVFNFYKITNELTNDIYVGRTRKTIEQRLSKHFIQARAFRERKLYKLLNAVPKEGVKVSLLESLESDSIELIREREAFYINELQANLNTCIPNRTQQQSKRAWYDKNKEAMSLKAKEKRLVDRVSRLVLLYAIVSQWEQWLQATDGLRTLAKYP